MSKRLIALALIGLQASSALSAELLFGNVVLTRTGFLNQPGFAMEYQPNGLYRQFFSVPRVTTHVQTDINRDVVVDRYGRLHVYNGTVNAVLSTLQSTSGTWTHTSAPGANSYSISHAGKLDMFWDYLFLTDHQSGPSQTSGMVRYNVSNGQTVRFGDPAQQRQPLDVAVGNDGLLYVLTGTNSPSGDKLDIYDPVSLQLIRSFDFYQTWQLFNTNLTVDASGHIYITGGNRRIYKLSPQAQLLQTLILQQFDGEIYDLDINRQGDILVTGEYGVTSIINSDFEEVITFTTFTPGLAPAFGAWVDSPVPEPMTMTSLGLATLVCLLRRKPKK